MKQPQAELRTARRRPLYDGPAERPAQRPSRTAGGNGPPAPPSSPGGGWPASSRLTRPASTRTSTRSAHAAHPGAVPELVPRRDARLEHVPAAGAALVVANHSGVLPFDAIMLQTGLLDEHRAAPQSPAARRRPGLRHPRAGHLARSRAATPGRDPARPTACWPAASWSACSPRGSRASASRSASATSCSASAGAGSPATAHRGRRADRALRDRRRRGDLPDDRECQAAGQTARPAVFPGDPAVPVARPARRGPAAVQLDHRILPAGADRWLPGRR